MQAHKTETRINNYSSTQDAMIYAYLWQMLHDNLEGIVSEVDGFRITYRETKTGIKVFDVHDI